MATIVREAKDPWWAPLAVNVLGGLVGGLVDDWRQREKNKKEAAYMGELAKIFGGDEQSDTNSPITSTPQFPAQSASQDAGQGLLSANSPEGYNSNGWASAFHNTTSPLSLFDNATAGLLGMPTNTPTPTPTPTTPTPITSTTTPPTTAATSTATPAVLPMQSQQSETSTPMAKFVKAMQLLGGTRFGMLGADVGQKLITPFMQLNEAARQEQMRNALAQDYTNAPDSAGRKNIAASAFLRQLVDNAGFNSLVNANTATSQNIDLGGSILPGTFDTWTGQTTYGEPLAKTLTPQQAADNAFRDRSFAEDVRRNNRDFAENNNRWWTSHGDSRIDADRNYGLQQRQLDQKETLITKVQVMPDGHVYGITGNGGTIQLSDIPGLTEAQRVELETNATTLNSLTKQLEQAESSKRVNTAKGLDTTEDDNTIKELRTKINSINEKNRLIINSINSRQSTADIGTANFQGRTTNGGKYRDIINHYAETYDVDPDLIVAMMMQESGGKSNATSSVGAMGLMQLMPGTAAELGVKDPYDPDQNLRGGIEYIARQLRAFNGDLYKALWAYNAGPSNAKKGRMPKPSETRPYITRIMNNYRRLKGLNSQPSSQQPAPPVGQSSTYNGNTPSTLPPVNPPVMPDITQQKYEELLQQVEKGNAHDGNGNKIQTREELDEFLRKKGVKVIGQGQNASSPLQTPPVSNDAAPAPQTTSGDATPTDAGEQKALDELNGEFGDYSYRGMPGTRDLLYRGPFYENPMDDPNLIPIPNDNPNEPMNMQLLGSSTPSQFARWAEYAERYNPQRHWRQFMALGRNNRYPYGSY